MKCQIYFYIVIITQKKPVEKSMSFFIMIIFYTPRQTETACHPSFRGEYLLILQLLDVSFHVGF